MSWKLFLILFTFDYLDNVSFFMFSFSFYQLLPAPKHHTGASRLVPKYIKKDQAVFVALMLLGLVKMNKTLFDLI